MKVRTSDIVFKAIEEKIFSGEWKPGTKISSEPQLAKELNVSRMSVREAIEKMVALNILIKRQGEGTFVSDLSTATYLNNLIPMLTLDKYDYMEILELRLVMDVESARLCARRCSDKTIEELEEAYREMIQYQGDMEKFTEKDLEFHMKIAQGTQNSLIVKINEMLRDILAYHQRGLYHNLGPEGGIKEHKFILDAIKNRDEELAGIFVRRHLERTIKDLKGMKLDLKSNKQN
ncbi:MULTISPECIES: FadR/GntR family transcriptional regulator [Clostridium]|jgi:GntR family transcriptional regulator, transcriptional repressor for pyruvate dehydrogenase complex|uniref:HTH-type transcriptional regulator LutR n=2 Tax=Clostridium TaxID=1485 RepID=A0A151AMV9_9CLOT|nr:MULTISPECIES: FadR/GntR family transcriptional regulator [Clostridium]KYH28969.1 HTH-type transcriptional regulator LutR [Clostridium colicanis DSM 13634]MBE6044835.1 FadR family transcriptional regulator [Clostridium thermopalmarium]PRR73243.1 HTH-type transcriptional regulator LutR [Clostridium thermopalmarium DSM 5974]PVZ25193.1 GntR family transcriptional regulator [Clostridium thermopalmarium DSM 5974]